jgi:alkaline phosphatase D
MASRREFLADLTRYAALAAVVPNDWRVTWHPRFQEDPFSLGVASGDPTPTGFTLWTRMAPRPLEIDGGMNGQRTAVSWEIADDEAFARVVRRGRATAVPELGFSIHVDVDGLEPDRWYHYRFTAGAASSAVGRARTTPAAGALTPLRLAFASCQHYEQGLFTAYSHLAREEVDLVAHLGDYIYEYAPGQGRVRTHTPRECLRLDDYRARYAQYKSDAHLKAAHARCPWVVTWDDHEVDNNYAALIAEEPMVSEGQLRARREAAYQAWWEHMPVRVPRAASWADLSIVRATPWGAMAHMWVLDTRQFRSDQACGDGVRTVPCGEWNDPRRTMLGATQEKWLSDGMGASRARWQLIANQLMVAPFDDLAGEQVRLDMDKWPGYPAARDRLLRTIADRAPNRTVVIAGDIHSNWVNELPSSFSTPRASTVAVELVGTSIASGGDGSDRSGNVTDRAMSENPHLRWQNARRGYVICEVGADQCVADYRTVPFVTRPDAPIASASRWRMDRGRPGVTRL